MRNRYNIKGRILRIVFHLAALFLGAAPLYATPSAIVSTSMQQYKSDGITAIAVGGTTTEATVIFSVPIQDTTSGHTVKLQVEVRQTGAGANFSCATFTASPISWPSACVESPLISAPTATTVTVTVNNFVSQGYHWRARAVDNLGNASAWTCFPGNNDYSAQCPGGGYGTSTTFVGADFVVSHPAAPNYTLMQQYQSDGVTTIGTGGVTNEARVILSVPNTDTEPGHTVQLQVEVNSTNTGGYPFSCSASFTTADGANTVSWPSASALQLCAQSNALTSSGTLTLTINQLVSGSYHWRARLIDNNGSVGNWTCYGNNLEYLSGTYCPGGGGGSNGGFIPAADFAVSHPPPPTNLQQTDVKTNSPISVGATTNNATIVFSATNTDVDAGHTAAIQVEVLPQTTFFASSGISSCSSFSNTAASYSWNGTQACIQTNVLSAGGATSSVTLTNLTTGSYHWRARLIDNNNSVSAWTCFGGNHETYSNANCPGGGGDGTSTNTTPSADFTISHPAPPPLGSLDQLQSGGAIIQPSATINDATIVFSATNTDVDAGHTAAIQVEVLPQTTFFASSGISSCSSFSNTAASYSWNGTQACIQTNVLSAGGATSSVTLTNLTTGSYHWRARLIDNNNSVSAWTCFGGNHETYSNANCPGGGGDGTSTNTTPSADFTISHPPNPTALNQYKSDGVTAIATGGTTTESTMIFKATGVDLEAGHSIRFRVEVQPTSSVFSCAAFSGVFDYSSNHCYEASAVSAGSATILSIAPINLVSGNYHWRAEIIDSNNSLSQWVCYGGNGESTSYLTSCPGGGATNASIGTDFIVSFTGGGANSPPNSPTALTQKTTTGTLIATGATTTENWVVLGGTITDPNATDTVRIQVEVRDTNTAFSNCTGGFNADGGAFPCVQGGTAVTQGGSPSVTVSGLTNNTNYHWQARSIDNSGAVSGWQAYPVTSPNADTPLPAAIDFRSSNQAPNAPANDANLNQYKSDGTTVITSAGTTNETTVVIKALISDPDGHDVQLAAEVIPTSGTFQKIANSAGSLVPSGTVGSVTVSGLTNGTTYKWQVWAIDKTGLAGSATAGPNPAFTISNAAPSIAALTQTAPGNNPVVTLGGTISDPDTGSTPAQTIKLQIEIRPVGQSFGACSSYNTGPVAWTGDAVTGSACGETALGAGGSQTITFGSGSAGVAAGWIPNGTFKWRARAIDNYGLPSAWLYYPNNATDPNTISFTISNTSPTLDLSTPTNGQFTTGSVAIATGTGTTTESSVLFKGTSADPDAGQQVKFQVEARPTSAAFGCASFSPATANCGESAFGAAGTASVALNNLNSGAYHWRARAVDSYGATSGWVCFGGNIDDITACPSGATAGSPPDTDFTVSHTTVSALTQVDAAGAVAAGGFTNYESVTLGGTTGDPDAENVKIQIEVRPASVAFTDPTSCASFDTVSPTGSFCAESAPAPGGPMTLIFSLPNGTYHWRARTVDASGSAGVWLNAAAVSGVSFEFAHPWTVTQASMTQFQSDGTSCLATSVAAGGTVGVPYICLKGDVGDVAGSAHTVKLQVEVQPIGTAFTNLPNAESAFITPPNGTTATTVSIVFTNLLNGISYQWQARAIDSNGKAGHWQAASQLGGFAFKVQNSPPSAPSLPAASSQYKADNVTAVPVAGTIHDTSLILKGTVTDPDGNSVKLLVEVRPTSAGFSCANPWEFFNTPSANPCVVSAAVASGSIASGALTNLANGDYHWRARALDANGALGPWVCFGGNLDTDPGCGAAASNAIDFTVNNRPPNTLAGTDLSQYKKDGTTLITTGGTTNDAELYLQSVVTEPDGQSVKTQMEVRPTGTAFSCASFSPPTTNCKETGLLSPTIIDGSTNKNNGVINQGAGSNITLGNTGKFGLGADFNGVDGNMAVPSASTIDNLGSAATFELWVKFNAFSTAASQTLLEKKSGDGTTTSYLLELLAGVAPAQLRFTAGAAGSVVTILSDATTITTAGVFYHVAVVYTGTASTSKIYINGADHTSGTPTGSGGPLPVSTGGPLQIGAGRVDGAELIVNPGFETGTCGTECAGPWVESNNTVDPYRWNQVTPYNPHSGGWFLVFPPGTNGHSNHTDLEASATQTIAVTPNTSYRLSGWVLRESAAGVVTTTMDLNGLAEGCSIAPALANGTWENIVCYFTAGQNTTSVTVRLHVARPSLQTGYIFFDDISLKALSSGSINELNGSLDDIRISNNLRYSANFTAPAAAFTSDANTMALYQFESWASTQKLLFSGLANGNYIWRARGVDSYGVASPWTSAQVDVSNNAFVINNRPPNAPTLQQYDKTGTPISLGGTIPDTVATIGLASLATLTDPDPNQTLQMQVELENTSTPFSCVTYATTYTPSAAAPCAQSPLVANGSTLPSSAFTYSGLSNNTSYHWKVKVVDQYGATTQVCFGANNDADPACNGSGVNAADFSVAHPAAPTALTQKDNMDVLGVGAATPTGLVQLGASVYDTDAGHTIGVRMEVRPVGSPFSCTTFTTGDSTQLCQQTNLASLTIPTPASLAFQLPNGSYYWRVQAIDSVGNASVWVNAPVDGTGASFVINNPPPTVITSTTLQQRNTADTLSIAVASVDAVNGTTSESGVLFKGTASDPTGEPVKLQVESRPVGTAFGCATFTSGTALSTTATNCAEGSLFPATILDSSGSAPLNNGSSFGGVRLGEPGQFGTGARFNGIDGWMNVLSAPTLDSLGSTATLELWAKFNTLTANTPQTLLEKKDSSGLPVSYLLEVSPGASAGQLRFTAGSAGNVVTILSANVLTTGAWYHIAVVYNGATPANSKIYINGADQTLSAVGTGGALPSAPTSLFTLGASSLGGANLISNPNFETGTFTPWVAGGGVTVNNALPHAGTYSALFPTSDTYDALTQDIPGSGNTTYRFSAWVNSALTAGMAAIDLNGLPRGCGAAAALSPGWQQIGCNFTTGPGDYAPTAAPTFSRQCCVSGRGVLYARYTWVTSDGRETLPSPETPIDTQGSYYINVFVPAFPPGIVGANVYVGSSSGAGTLQSPQIATSGGVWSEPTTLFTITGSLLPSTTTVARVTPRLYVTRPSANTGDVYFDDVSLNAISPTNLLNGSIDEVRLSNVARYGAPFTPSAAAFTSDANTLALYHFDNWDTIVNVTIPNLPGNGNYHWRARAADRTGLAQSTWSCFGGNNDASAGNGCNGAADQADFILSHPAKPTGLTQFKNDQTTVIAVGGTTNETSVYLQANLGDSNSLHAVLTAQFEVKPLATPFDGTTTNVAPGPPGVYRLYLSALPNDTYHWRVRTSDAYAGVTYVSDWAYPGGADGAHFIVSPSSNANNTLYPSGLSACCASTATFVPSGSSATALRTDDGTASYASIGARATTSGTGQILYMNFDPPPTSWTGYMIAGIQLHVKDISDTIINPAPSFVLYLIGAGTLPNSTPVYIKYTWVYPTGESSASAALAQTTFYCSTTPCNIEGLRIQVPTFPVGVTSAKIYASLTSGSEVLQGSVSVSGGTFDLLSLATGTQPPPQARTFKLGVHVGSQDYFDANNHAAGAPAIYGVYPVTNGDYLTSNPTTGQAWTWSDITNLVGVIKNTEAVPDSEIRITQLYVTLDLVATMFLTYAQESGYGTDGVSPDAGPATATYTYKVVYTHFKNSSGAEVPPTGVKVHIDGDPVGIAMTVDSGALDSTKHNGIYSDGEQYVYSTTLAAGTHSYYFDASDGTTTIRLPNSGVVYKPAVNQPAGFLDVVPDLPALQTNDGTTSEAQLYNGTTIVTDTQTLQDPTIDGVPITSVQVYAVFDYKTTCSYPVTSFNIYLGFQIADPLTGSYSTYYESVGHQPPASYGAPTASNDVYYTNPLTGNAWTWRDIKNMQSYIRLTEPAACNGIYYTQIFVRVTYSPLSLSYPNEVGYGTDGLNPEAGSGTTPYVYKVIYNQLNNVAPAAGYPRVRIDTVPDPATTPTLGSFVSGAFSRPATTFYARYTWVSSGGQETLASPEMSGLVNANSQLQVTVPAFPSGLDVVAANVYVSTSPGTETKQAAQITTSGGTWTEPVSQFTTTGSAVPAANTIGQVFTMTDSGVGSYATGRAFTFTPAPNSLAAGKTHLYYFDAQDAASSPPVCLPNSSPSSCGTNQLVGPAVSLNAFQMVILPNNLSGCCVSSFAFAPTTGQKTNLRSNDGDTSVATSAGSTGPGETLYMDMDNPTQVPLFIKSLTVRANMKAGTAQFRLGLRVNGADYLGSAQSTSGTAGTYLTSPNLYSGAILYSNNPATGKPWTWGDIKNLIAVVQHPDNAATLTVTYLDVLVDLTPVSLDYSQETNYMIKGVNPDIGKPTTTFTYKVVYTHLNGVAPQAVRIHIDSDIIGSPTRPNDSGTGTIVSGKLTDSSKSWSTNQWTNFYLIDASWTSFLITSNTATVLTVSSGTPVAGAYAIYTNPSKINMALDTGAVAGLQNGNYADGEQYIYTTTLPAGNHDYYFETADGLYTTASTNKNWLPPSTYAGGTVQKGPLVDTRAGSIDLHPTKKNLCCLASPSFTFGGTGDLTQTDPSNALDGNDGDTSYAASSLYGDRLDMDIDNPDLSYRFFYITSVQVMANIRDNGGGASTGVNLGMRVNGKDYSASGTTITPNSVSYNLYAGPLYPVNPDSGTQWTWQDIDDLVATAQHAAEETGTAGVGGLNSLTDSSKNWSVNWTGHTLLDSAGNTFAITGSGATTLTVSGTPASGSYKIYNSNPLYVTELFIRVSFSPVGLSYSPNSGYVNDGVNPDSGFANTASAPTLFTYRSVYSQAFNIAPTNVRVYLDGDLVGVALAEELTSTTLGDLLFNNGEHYTTQPPRTLAPAPSHTYRFDANDGTDTALLPPLLTLHPSGKAVSVASTGWSFSPAGSEASALDTADGAATVATSSALNDRLYMEMDDTALSNDWAIRSVSVSANIPTTASTTFQIGVRINGTDYLNGVDFTAGAGTYSSVINGATPTLNPNTNLPWTWQNINNLEAIVVHTGANPLSVSELYITVNGVKTGPLTTVNTPQLSFSAEPGYQGDTADPNNGQGVEPNSGAEGTSFTYKVVYTHPDNVAPAANSPQVFIDGNATGFVMTPDIWIGAVGDYTVGRQYSYTTTSLLAGRHTYYFSASDGISVARLPVGANLVQNPGFESGTGGTANNWTGAGARASDQKYTGADSLKFVGAGTSKGAPLSLLPSNTYFISGYVLVDPAATGTATIDLVTVVSGVDTPIVGAGNCPATAVSNISWQPVACAVTTPTSITPGTLVYPRLRVSGSGSFWFDEIGVTPAVGTLLSDPTVTTTVNNTVTLHPASKNALSSKGWTFVGATPDSALDSNDGDTSYATSSAKDDRLYMFLDPTSRTLGTINGITITAVARYNGTTNSDMQIGFCLTTCGGANDYLAASGTLASTYNPLTRVNIATNPATGQAWTWSDINKLILWVNHATNSNEIRVTELRVDISVSNTPSLTFSPEGGYITDGVNPDGGRPSSAAGPTPFVYKIVYNHGANLPPDAGYPQVIIDGIAYQMKRDVADANHNGLDDDLFPGDPLRDGDFTNGEQYVYATTLPMAVGQHTYQFKVVVGGTQTVQTPVLTGPNTSLQSPTLTYSPDIGYQTDGVDPNSGDSNTNFAFKVVYTQADNNPPVSISVVIDGVPYAMQQDTLAAAALRDGVYTNGEQYVKTLKLPYLANGHSYSFIATDGVATAVLPIDGSRFSGPIVTLNGPPNAITDLQAVSQTPTSVTLQWTAPGKDSLSTTGSATAYDLRYSTRQIVTDDTTALPTLQPWQIRFSQIDPTTDLSLDSSYYQKATGLPTPSLGGTVERFTINNLIPNTAYYFAIKAANELYTNVTNLPISNVVNGANNPPLPVTNLAAGFNAVSLPLIPTTNTVEAIFSGVIGTGALAYQWTSTGPAITDGSYIPRLFDSMPLTMAKGYFIQAPDAGRVLITPGSPNAAASVVLPLLWGFNMIGNPYTHEVLLENTLIRCAGTGPACGLATGVPGTVDKTFANAVTAGWVDNGILLWNGAGYDFVTIVSAQKPTLRLWKGYWLHLLKNDAAYSIVITKP